MTTLLTIPISPEALTAPWLTEALRSAGTLTNAAVRSCAAERIDDGAGVMSQVLRLHLDYDADEPGAPRRLIAKFPTESLDRFYVGRLLRFYEREVGFYAQMQELVPLRTPRCHYHAIDPATDEFVLLLEDLAPGGAGDQVTGCPLPKVELAVDEAAALHAALWEHPVLDTLPWMSSWEDPAFVPFFTESFRRAWDLYRRDPLVPIPAQVEAVGGRLHQSIQPLLDQLSRPPRTLLHGDYRFDNLFFTGPALAVIDWQLCARGRGVFDVAYLLSQSVAPSVRRAEEMRLLRRYHQRLTAEGVAGYSREECLLDYRRAVLLGLAFPVIAAITLGRAQGRDRALAAAMLERSMTAVLDLDAGELLG